MKKKCTDCNAEFECESTPKCWCMDVPRLSEKEITNDNCMCKTCLLKKISKRFKIT